MTLELNGSTFDNLDLGLSVAEVHEILAAPDTADSKRKIAAMYDRLGGARLGINRPAFNGMFKIPHSPGEPRTQVEAGLRQTIAHYLEEHIFQIGDTFLDSQNFESAEDYYKSVVEKYPSNALAHAKIALIYWERRSYIKAIDLYDAALKLSPKDKAYWILAHRAIAYNDLGRHEKALDDICCAVQCAPDHEKSWVLTWKAIILGATATHGNNEALANHNEAIKYLPDSSSDNESWVLTHRALTYKRMGDFRSALNDNCRAVKAKPRDAWLLTHRAITYRELREFDKSIDDLTEACGLVAYRSSDWLRVHRALTYEEKGDFGLAMKDAEDALRINPGDDWILGHLNRIRKRAINWSSCLISYSTKDSAFAEKLCADLGDKGVPCWLAPRDLAWGAKIREVIAEEIRIRDRLIVVISQYSLASEWVGFEVNCGFDQEQSRTETVVLPISLDGALIETRSGQSPRNAWASRLRDQTNVGDFRGWEDAGRYAISLERLLTGLAPGPGKAN